MSKTIFLISHISSILYGISKPRRPSVKTHINEDGSIPKILIDGVNKKIRGLPIYTIIDTANNVITNQSIAVNAVITST